MEAPQVIESEGQLNPNFRPRFSGPRDFPDDDVMRLLTWNGHPAYAVMFGDLPFRSKERLGRLTRARHSLAIIAANVVLLFLAVEQESPG